MLIKVETEEQKRARIEQWHNKFAIFPIKIGSGQWVWLETVSRKAVYSNIAPVDDAAMMEFQKLKGKEWAFKHWSYRRKVKP